MKTPIKNRDKIKSERLIIALSPTEKNRLDKYAENQGLSMSTMARVILNDFFKKEELRK